MSRIKYRVGDTVKVRPLKELLDICEEVDSENDLEIEGDYFVLEMRDKCECVGVVMDIGIIYNSLLDKHIQNIYILFEGENELYPFSFTAPMLELVKESEIPFKQTIVVDFDGVVNSYKSGYNGIDTILDPPTKGIKKAIDDMREKGYNVVIQSSRCRWKIGREAIKEWLDKNDIKVDDITDSKPAAIAVVDDRAIVFNGHSATLLDRIKRFKPWYKKEK